MRLVSYLTPLFLLLASSAMASPMAWLDPSAKQVRVGDVFSLDVRIEGAVDLGDFEFTLYFDDTALDGIIALEGPFFAGHHESWLPHHIEEDVDAGYFLVHNWILTWPDDPGVTGDGVLATLIFRAVRAGVTDVYFGEFMVAYGHVGEHLSAEDPSSPFHRARITVVPEPSRLLIVVTGLFAAWTGRRRSSCR